MAIDWTKAIETICTKRGWSLRRLAGDMGVSANYLSEVTTGKRPPSLALKIKIAGRLEWNKTSDLLVELLPDDAAKAWAEWDERTTESLGKKADLKADNIEAKEAKKTSKATKDTKPR
ncbi:XRE family transcriptional regulator [Burkholderia thailandensis]|uniref:helix-turn-helix domain-containing protein n=1 Tax=Burkholderia thailandensis TaxID=57975 RepID=UPI000375C60F|nr:helix-turn-helix transcriptional regulator [Burkholderia thailandensis]TBW60237.1 XRE family transcriptional regulator [Burkholderia thailandensis]